jgi:dATP pyrophosphohydrolase
LKNSDYKRPESVLVVVHTRAGEVLMLQRRQPPDFWQSVTGSLKWGESPLVAAQRELREETGLEGEIIDCHKTNRFPMHPVWRARYAPGTDTNLEHVFRAEFASRPEVGLNPQEHQSCRWLSRAAAAELASSWTNRDAILDYVLPMPDGS